MIEGRGSTFNVSVNFYGKISLFHHDAVKSL